MERKSIISTLESRFGCKAKYLGAPSFVYELETEKGNLRVERDGQIRTETGEIIDFESVLSEQREMTTESELWAEHEMHHMEIESANVPDYSNRGPCGGDELSDLDNFQITDEPDRMVIEIPMNDFTEESIRNLEKLIASKANLIKKVFEAEDLPLERTDDTLRFPWFKLPYDSEVVLAYSQFIIALTKAAKRQKWIVAKEKETENEKYAFRCFLLRLGFIGDEYKTARKILLSRLDGNSAFKQPKQSAEV